MPQINPQLVAGGNISASRFVSPDLGTDFSVVQASAANQRVIGISQSGTREAPIPAVTTPYAAQDGEQLRVHGEGEVCLLTLGATVAAFDQLKTDANGKGVVITAGTTTQEIGAVALQSGDADELILVQVTLRSEGQTAISS
jgi:hypothetical protein